MSLRHHRLALPPSGVTSVRGSGPRFGSKPALNRLVGDDPVKRNVEANHRPTYSASRAKSSDEKRKKNG